MTKTQPEHDKVELTVQEHATILRWQLEELRDAFRGLGEALARAAKRMRDE